MNVIKIWIPVLVLIITISGQWLVVVNKLLDMQQQITEVKTLMTMHLNRQVSVKKGDTRGRTAFAELKYGHPGQ